MRKPLWRAQEVAAACRASATGAWVAEGVSIDSRKIASGDLFFAITGERVDGHQYIASALEKGAAAAVVSHAPEVVDASRLVVVQDTFDALQALGAAARRRMAGKVVGITGSVGKTSTRAMMHAALAAYGTVHATVGNLNNHYGVPLTLARMPEDSAYAVIEMGMNHAGEIASLTQQAQPHVAVITTVEAVHLEHFANVEAIADAKSEIFEGLASDGVAVINRDSPYYERMLGHVAGRRVVSFGRSPEAAVQLVRTSVHGWGLDAAVMVAGREYGFHLPHPGTHFAMNAAAVLAVLHALGLPLEAGAAALAHVVLDEGRGQPVILSHHGHPVTLVDDSYNASPASMRAAFQVMAGVTPPEGGRKIALLGEMLELGEDSPALHAGLRDDVVAAGFDVVFTAGRGMEPLFHALPAAMQGQHVLEAAMLLPILQQALQPHDWVLAKGSHGSKIYALVASLHDVMKG